MHELIYSINSLLLIKYSYFGSAKLWRINKSYQWDVNCLLNEVKY